MRARSRLCRVRNWVNVSMLRAANVDGSRGSGSERLFEGRSLDPSGHVPQQQFVDAVHGVIGDAFEHVPQVGRWVHAIEFGRSDEAVHGGSTLAASIGAGEQEVVATECDAAQTSLGRRVVDLGTRTPDRLKRCTRCGASPELYAIASTAAPASMTRAPNSPGHTKRPLSKRFASNTSPCPSNHGTLMMSPRRPRKTNTCPQYRLSASAVCTTAARPLKPLRMSV